MINSQQQSEIHIWPIERLVFYARNPRKNDAAVDRMVASIREYGFKIPVLARSDGEVVDGHLRLKAARKLGLSEVPVILCDEWTPAQVKAFRLMVNRSVTWAEWDDDLLGLELLDSKNLDFDLGLTGFDDEELAKLLAAQEATDGLCDEDAVPPAPQTPTSKMGDLWLLDRHRLVCGDSTVQQTVSRVLVSVKPTLLVTDQPYGVEYDPEWRKRAGVNNSNRMGKVRNDDRADWREAYALFPGDVAYVWHGALHGDVIAANLAGCGLQPRAQIIWSKQHFTLGRGDYHWKHEVCWYAVREGKTSHWQGDRRQTTVWEIANNNPFGNPQHEQSWGHGTQKPVECMRRPIANNSRPGQAIYDPFLGSGTSLIAAEMTGRVCYGVELNPGYVDVVVRRWQGFTGRAAIHQASGQSFDERAASQQRDQSGSAHG